MDHFAIAFHRFSGWIIPFVYLNITIFSPIERKENEEKIAIYKTQLTKQQAEDLEKICGSDIDCWNRERAILSGMKIKKKTKFVYNPGLKMCTTRRKHQYLKEGVVVYED